MSHCYDVMTKAWNHFAKQLPETDSTLTFWILIEAMHSANHRHNDIINKDHDVTRIAMQLEASLKAEGV